MTREELLQRFPNASEQFITANTHARAIGIATSSQPKPTPRPRPLATPQGKTRHTGKYFIRVTSYRIRLLDEDNLVAKYHIDALRYAGVIHSDAPDQAHIVTRQTKIAKKDQERTEIQIHFPTQ